MTGQVKLYEIPKVLETARILDDSILDAYNDSLKGFNEKARQILGMFKKTDGELAGPSSVMLVHLVNSGILPSGTRLATRSDLQKAISFAPNFLEGRCTDCGLNLVSKGEYLVNPFLAKTLADDLKKVGIDLKDAKLIPYNILTLQADINSPSGLVFRLSEEGKDRAKDLILNTSDFKWNCSPSFNGLFRAYLNRYGSWGSDYGRLAYSDGSGRVVVVSAEGERVLSHT